MEIPKYVYISNSDHDCLIWSLAPSGSFSFKSLFRALVSPNSFVASNPFPWKRIWTPLASLKIKDFVWLVALNKVNTHDVLQRRNPYMMISPNIFFLCMEEMEFTNHIFIHCKFTYSIWSHFYILGISRVLLNDALDFIRQCSCGFLGLKR